MYHTGETVVLVRRHKRRKEIAELLEALLAKHRSERIYVAWDNATTHENDEIEAVVRGAAGRLVLLYLPTYSPWLNPIEMLWRHYRREVTHCELFDSAKALVEATKEFYRRYNDMPEKVLSIIGAIPQIQLGCTYRKIKLAMLLERCKDVTVVAKRLRPKMVLRFQKGLYCVTEESRLRLLCRLFLGPRVELT